ncbi:hypothetical protein J8273_0793 [Carpediemonas membranifera]|uniref:Uncharacterized protein n=1 Tax=Carpediemonas membranifera TaxID=201153 RepID=A0A8J6AZ96_9EUKA|nr:hypothetical protein J8273_0793 [Carpediemonas membranifera]|eukprot:KAG9397663.1 hypothetical protein J8273_0793 [Carpediemonas membranifera]
MNNRLWTVVMAKRDTAVVEEIKKNGCELRGIERPNKYFFYSDLDPREMLTSIPTVRSISQTPIHAENSLQCADASEEPISSLPMPAEQRDKATAACGASTNYAIVTMHRSLTDNETTAVLSLISQRIAVARFVAPSTQAAVIVGLPRGVTCAQVAAKLQDMPFVSHVTRVHRAHIC